MQKLLQLVADESSCLTVAQDSSNEIAADAADNAPHAAAAQQADEEMPDVSGREADAWVAHTTTGAPAPLYITYSREETLDFVRF